MSVHSSSKFRSHVEASKNCEIINYFMISLGEFSLLCKAYLKSATRNLTN